MNNRKIKLNKHYVPLPSHKGDEIYPNGIFKFNISKILEYIADGKLNLEIESINISAWLKTWPRFGKRRTFANS